MQVLGMVFISTCIAVVTTLLVIKVYLFPSAFSPVELSPGEARQLAAKIEKLEGFNDASAPQKNEHGKDGSLIPEKYSEDGATRDINFTERELNALLAKNTDLAKKLAIDLADNMVSLKLLVPLDPDLPVLGGKTLKIKAGAELAYRDGRPVLKLRGISLMGIPMPNAWLGGMKNIDLIKEYGTQEGFWKTFADGVDSIHVVEGRLKVRLKE
ncbi:arginine N-succinyltransferase [Desulfopila sp. IMCC35006]|nr:arginine N-succinyltransferase [Desulfopila sp. IMCC35006]